MDNYAYTSELPCKLPASRARLICPGLEKCGHRFVTVAQKFWSGCHTWIEARWTRENASFSVASLLEVEITKSKGLIIHFRTVMVKFSVLAPMYFPLDSAAGILISTSSTNSFFTTFFPPNTVRACFLFFFKVKQTKESIIYLSFQTCIP